MPNAPKRHRPVNRPPIQQVRKQMDQRRGTAHSRGYTKEWNEYSRQLCRDRVFCELCLEIGRETSIVRGTNQPGKRRQIVSVVDHIVPVDGGQSDPLFWELTNHWCLCVECDRWKSATFDGGYGKPRREAVRTIEGVLARRAGVVAERLALTRMDTQ